MDKRVTIERNQDYNTGGGGGVGGTKHTSTNSLDSDSKSSSLNSKHANEAMVKFDLFFIVQII